MKRQSVSKNEKGNLAILDPNVPRVSKYGVIGKRIEATNDQENEVVKKPRVDDKIEKAVTSKFLCYASPYKRHARPTKFPQSQSSSAQLSIDQWLGDREDLENVMKTEIRLESKLKLARNYCKNPLFPIESGHREICIDWIINVQRHLKAGNETAHLAVNLFDTFVNARRVELDDLQIIAAACIWLAHKFHHGGINAKSILNFCEGGSLSQLRSKERHVLQAVNMQVIFTNPITLLNYHWFTLFSFDVPRVEYYASNYFLELMAGSINFVHLSSNFKTYLSVLATLNLFKLTTNKRNPWGTPKVVEYYNLLLDNLRLIRNSAEFRSVSAIYKKYNSPRYGSVSAHPFMDPDRM